MPSQPISTPKNDANKQSSKVAEEYGNLSDDNYYELTKEGGGELDLDFVYIYEYQLRQYRDVIFSKDILRAPTISEVLKWLREEKRLVVDINCNYTDYFPNVRMLDIRKTDYISGCDIYETYEEAALAGIEYVLNELI